MQIKKRTLKKLAIIFSAVFFLIALVMFLTANNPTTSANTQTTNNAVAQPVIVDGKQIAEITANFSGYQPGVLELKGGIPTTLKINSVNNFGCGSAFRIPKLGVSMNLPINGVNEVDLGTQAAGTTLDAMCSMGMYRMKIKFI